VCTSSQKSPLCGRQSPSLTYVGAIGRDSLRVTHLSDVNPNFSNVVLTDNSATSDHNALQLKFRRPLSRGVEALVSYTFSHSIDNASTDTFTTNTFGTFINTPSWLANPNIDRGDSGFDIRHSFTAGVTYNLPAPGTQKVTRAVLRDWSLASFILARSAPPVNIVAGVSFLTAWPLIPVRT
jgi:hypothetical protein